MFVSAWIVANTARAQTNLDLSLGAWDGGTRATRWSAGYSSRLLGPIDYGLAVTHLDDHRSPLDRTATGGEFSIGVRRLQPGPYLIASAGLGMKHRDANIDAEWSAGAGYGTRVLSVFTVALELRYRAEDQYSRGFWNLDPSDRRGIMALGKISFNLAGPARMARPNRDVPNHDELERAASRNGVGRNELAADIVATALDAMGKPYRWGGGGAKGYDCSGLIQFAYSENGISIPRTSHEQASYGRELERQVAALAPGDILGFAVEGGGVTHVGLYVGNGQFIHSASKGVKLSSLTANDPDSLWWQTRWIAARRIL
jgi:cell wall-associated NlpC family hydrolase